MLDMYGHIDMVFRTSEATLYRRSGRYLPTGEWEEGMTEIKRITINDQPATAQQIKWLNPGGERNIELRNVYVNDGTMIYPSRDGFAADELQFDADGRGLRRWKVVQSDCRPSRNYCHAVVEKLP